MKKSFYIGSDIGGTTFSSALFNNGKLINISNKELVKNFKTQKDLINALSAQILKLANQQEIMGVGIACPGPLSAKNGIILDTPNLKILQNCNIIKKITKATGLPCKIENDANLFALGEYKYLNKKTNVFIGITLGTGLGFGIIVNNKLFIGGNGMAAEYGISPINDENWESQLSIRGLNKNIKKYYNKPISPKELTILAQNNDKHALIIWDNIGKNLGKCLSHIINMLDPNTISISGGLSGAFLFFCNSMNNEIKSHSPSFNENNIIIYESQLKEISAMYGATLLFT